MKQPNMAPSPTQSSDLATVANRLWLIINEDCAYASYGYPHNVDLAMSDMAEYARGNGDPNEADLIIAAGKAMLNERGKRFSRNSHRSGWLVPC